jgi:transcriptional antiterminator RfaH
VHWFCVYTRPQKEAQVAAYCRSNLGLECYLPRLRQHRTIRRKRQLVTSPLFPRYLFCRFDLGQSCRAVRYAPDALDLVQTGNGPVVVEDSLVDEIRTWAGEGDEIITLKCDLSVGDTVEVSDGPMRGLSATILHVDDARDRVAVLLSILQGAQLMLSRSQIRRVA